MTPTPPPTPVGTTEIAEYLGLSRQRVDQLTREATFPPMQYRLRGGARVWFMEHIVAWAEATGRVTAKRDES